MTGAVFVMIFVEFGFLQFSTASMAEHRIGAGICGVP
jgi:hypothetical protein